MVETALARKLKRKSTSRAAILNAPPGYQAGFSGMPRADSSLTGKYDWIQIFVRTEAELKKLAPRAVRALGSNSLLWVAFPKGTSKIQTDLTRDRGWDSLRELELKWVTLVSVNDTWSAFGLRPFKTGEARSKPWS